MEYGLGLRPHVPYVVVKVPVFSFSKMRGVETVLGPEMKSTGEVLGIDDSFGGALLKGFLARAFACRTAEDEFWFPSPTRKEESIPVLRAYAAQGHTLVATPGTRATLEEAGIASEAVNKISDGSPHVLDLIASRAVDLVINDAKGPREISDDYKIRRAAVEANIACLTSLDTARALAEALTSKAGPPRSLQEYRSARTTIAR